MFPCTTFPTLLKISSHISRWLEGSILHSDSSQINTNLEYTKWRAAMSREVEHIELELLPAFGAHWGRVIAWVRLGQWIDLVRNPRMFHFLFDIGGVFCFSFLPLLVLLWRFWEGFVQLSTCSISSTLILHIVEKYFIVFVLQQAFDKHRLSCWSIWASGS